MPLALKRSYYRGNSLWSHRFCCFVRGCAVLVARLLVLNAFHFRLIANNTVLQLRQKILIYRAFGSFLSADIQRFGELLCQLSYPCHIANGRVILCILFVISLASVACCHIDLAPNRSAVLMFNLSVYVCVCSCCKNTSNLYVGVCATLQLGHYAKSIVVTRQVVTLSL